MNQKNITVVLLLGILGAGGMNLGVDRIAPVETDTAVLNEKVENIGMALEEIKGSVGTIATTTSQIQLNQVQIQGQLTTTNQQVESNTKILDERTIPVAKVFELEDDIENLQDQAHSHN